MDLKTCSAILPYRFPLRRKATVSKPLTIELPPEVARRVQTAASQEGLSEGEWVAQLILKSLPSNYAQEVEKLKDFLDD